jgi:hypothetical protein
MVSRAPPEMPMSCSWGKVPTLWYEEETLKFFPDGAKAM